VVTISGVEDGKYYNTDVTPVITITDTDLQFSSITLNGAPFSSGTPVIGEGVYTLVATANDKAGDATSKTVKFTIDNTAPVVTPPADVTKEATGPLTPVTIGTATATDAVGVVSITNNAPVAGYPVGTTIVTWTATDAAGNKGTATQKVTVVDTTAPIVTPPADVTKEANGPLTPVVIGTATATDAEGVVSITNNAPSAGYPVGTTTVTWTATDAAGNKGTATQKVTVTAINAKIEFDPNTLNLKSQGGENAFTAFIELPSGYDISKINVASIELLINGTKVAGAQLTPTLVGDHYKNGVADQMVKFDRQGIIAGLGGNTGDNIALIVRGNLTDSRYFIGSNTIRVTNPGK
jgi:hypothetical protein